MIRVDLSPIGDILSIPRFNKQLKLRNNTIPLNHNFIKHYSFDLADMHQNQVQFEEKELDPKKIELKSIFSEQKVLHYFATNSGVRRYTIRNLATSRRKWRSEIDGPWENISQRPGPGRWKLQDPLYPRRFPKGPP